MDRSLVAQTRFKGLRRLGVAGRHAQDAWHQIDAYLRTAFGPEAAALFAEPVSAADGSVHWYASGDSDPVAVSRLGDGEREALIRALEFEHARISGEARRLSEHRDPAQKRMGAILEAALSFAEDGDGHPPLYSMDGRPVLVNWGTRIDAPEAPADPLQDYVRRIRKPPAPPLASPDPELVEPEPVIEQRVAPVDDALTVRRERDWLTPLTWLLLALLVATLFFMLLRPCGITWLTGDRYCPGVLQARTLGLSQEIESLEQQLNSAQSCPVEDAFEDRREKAGGSTGAVTVTLIWNDVADLDLEIACPGGGVIDFENKESCGGVLDIDRNDTAAEAVADPIENIAFTAAPAAGQYRISVIKFVNHKLPCPSPGNCAARWYRPGPVPFEVELKQGDKTQRFRGVVSDGEKKQVAEFRG